ncbi:hypothetical protein [uncultured Tateyamaria sp.]|uniref:hypothetical protein n=1 Tax=uncultured Tateyamaria sp. TaxID=455651 RepID=UPI0026226D0D|nr:hypothetical protein [uncultured Tateyamaria sp.]
MSDKSLIVRTLKGIISRLDPKQSDVAICHLRDAIAAIEAVSAGRATEYARDDTIRNGVVGRVTPFR